MARKGHTAEQIILKLREAEVALAQGQCGASFILCCGKAAPITLVRVRM